MKKIISIILILVLTGTLITACSPEPAPVQPPVAPTPPTATPDPPPQEPSAAPGAENDDDAPAAEAPAPVTPMMISAEELRDIHGDDNVIVIGVVSPTSALVPFSNAANPVRNSFLVWVDDYLGLNPEESFYPGDTIYRMPLSHMEDLLSRAGATEDSIIVVFSSDWLSQGARVAWHLAMLGLNVRFLDGGVAAWRALSGTRTGASNRLSGQSVQTNFTAPNYAPASFSVSVPQVVEALQNPDEWVVIDTRTLAEFNGTSREAGAYGTGRLRGAVFMEWEDVFDSNGLLLPDDQLRSMFAFIGDRSVIVYCQGGVRSAYTWIVLRDLGFNVYNFDGSWIHWSWAASNFSDYPSDVIVELTEEWTDNNGKIS
jgi:thiosulfate/3-mercaptopyruvate sulfurtransferase